MLAFLNQVRKPTLDLPLDVRRKMWFKPFMQSYLVVFIGYLTMYLIRKNFNIAQNDMISTYGLSMTQLGMIGLWMVFAQQTDILFLIQRPAVQFRRRIVGR